MTAEVQSPNNILDPLHVPNKKIKLNEEDFKDNAYKEILQVEVKRREKAESEVKALNEEVKLLQEDMTRAEERCAIATQRLEEISKNPTEKSDSAATKKLATVEANLKLSQEKSKKDESKIQQLEKELTILRKSKTIGGQAPILKGNHQNIESKLDAEDLAKKIQGLLSKPLTEFQIQAKVIADETSKKFEATANKLAMAEVNLEKAQEKSKNDQTKILELENELKALSKSLQMSMLELKEEAPSEEISFSNMEAETRAQYAEGNAEKLQNEVDRLKQELQVEQERNKNLQEEMEATLQDIQNM